MSEPAPVVPVITFVFAAEHKCAKCWDELVTELRAAELPEPQAFNGGPFPVPGYWINRACPHAVPEVCGIIGSRAPIPDELRIPLVRMAGLHGYTDAGRRFYAFRPIVPAAPRWRSRVRKVRARGFTLKRAEDGRELAQGLTLSEARALIEVLTRDPLALKPNTKRKR